MNPLDFLKQRFFSSKPDTAIKQRINKQEGTSLAKGKTPQKDEDTFLFI